MGSMVTTFVPFSRAHWIQRQLWGWVNTGFVPHTTTIDESMTLLGSLQYCQSPVPSTRSIPCPAA